MRLRRGIRITDWEIHCRHIPKSYIKFVSRTILPHPCHTTRARSLNWGWFIGILTKSGWWMHRLDYRFPLWFHLKFPIKRKKCTLPITKFYNVYFYKILFHVCCMNVSFPLILYGRNHPYLMYVKDFHCLAHRSIHSLKVAQSCRKC